MFENLAYDAPPSSGRLHHGFFASDEEQPRSAPVSTAGVPAPALVRRQRRVRIIALAIAALGAAFGGATAARMLSDSPKITVALHKLSGAVFEAR